MILYAEYWIEARPVLIGAVATAIVAPVISAASVAVIAHMRRRPRKAPPPTIYFGSDDDDDDFARGAAVRQTLRWRP